MYSSHTIVELVNTLYQKERDVAVLVQWFKDRGFRVKIVTQLNNTPFENRVIIISYKNYIQLWSKWARQARGVVLFLDNKNNWTPIKYMFQRGAELLTRFHDQKGINETENITEKFPPVLDIHQQWLAKAIITDMPIQGYLSMKVDGMLVPITLYTGLLKEIFEPIIINGKNTFAKAWVELSKPYPFLPIISTHNTFIVEQDQLITYITTAIMLTLGITHHNDHNPVEMVLAHGQKFLEKLNILYQKLSEPGPVSEAVTICFEAVCPYRTCFWGTVHNELAISYETRFIRCLSYSVGLKTYPHFLWSQTIQEMGLAEPYWWKLPVDINKIMDSLSKYIRGEMTHEQFMDHHPPSNLVTIKIPLDHEGFVIWSHEPNYNKLKSDYLDYNKLKSSEYYICHKPRDIRDLEEIASKTQLFPSAIQTYHFMKTLEEKLNNVCYRLIDILNKNIQNQSGIPYTHLSEKAKNSFKKQPDSIRYRMLMSHESWGHICYDVFTEHFPELKNSITSQSGLIQIFKSIIKTIQIESPDYKDRINKLIQDRDSKLEELYQNCFANISMQTSNSTIDYISFIVYGCPKSTDIDMAVILPTLDFTHLELRFNYDRLRKELQEIDYDIVHRTLDLNFITIDNGDIKYHSKGGDQETQNIIYYTYHHHKQKYICPVTRPCEIDFVEKIRIVAKYILDHLKTLLFPVDYLKIRMEKKQSYYGYWTRVIYIPSLVPLIIKTVKADDQKWKDSMKALIMKLIQLFLIEKGDIEYTKEGLAQKCDNLFPSTYEHALWYLFRGTRGTYDHGEFLKILFDHYMKIAQIQGPCSYEWQKLEFDLERNPTELPNDLYLEFVKSPIRPTDRFRNLFQQLSPYRNINPYFQIKCMNENLLPQELRANKIISVDQRSDEWLTLLTYYKCGTHIGHRIYTGDDWIEYYYNLIRGSVVELMIINNADFGKPKVTVGMIVEDKKENSAGFAPDLLLMDENDKIIPVEIKCLMGQQVDNCDTRRAIHLATKQIENCLRILGFDYCSYGLIVLVYVYQKQNQYVFDAQMCKIILKK